MCQFSRMDEVCFVELQKKYVILVELYDKYIDMLVRKKTRAIVWVIRIYIYITFRPHKMLNCIWKKNKNELHDKTFDTNLRGNVFAFFQIR